jgi:uncharacterized OsmC-like protein
MDAEALRARQAPLKQQYKDDPQTARVVMTATGIVQPSMQNCRVASRQGEILAGLHPAAGGSGQEACSGDMLLQALIACSGVTVSAVATAMGLAIRSVKLTASASMDFRGTLGVDKSVPVGFTSIDLKFEFDSDCTESQLNKLFELTERYCVIWQSLQQPAKLSSHWVAQISK